MVDPKETPAPLTDEEVKELDSYGIMSARDAHPARAIELWTRELLWGRVNPEPHPFDAIFEQYRK